MDSELLLLIKKHTDTLIQQTKTKPKETLEFKMKKQVGTFWCNPPINLSEEGKWLLAVTSFEATNSVFNIINENNSISIIIPGRGRFPNYLDVNIIDKLMKLLKFRSQNNIESHVKEVRRRGNQIKIGDEEEKLSDFDASKKEILEEL